jgi:hypothetical protein
MEQDNLRTFIVHNMCNPHSILKYPYRPVCKACQLSQIICSPNPILISIILGSTAQSISHHPYSGILALLVCGLQLDDMGSQLALTLIQLIYRHISTRSSSLYNQSIKQKYT